MSRLFQPRYPFGIRLHHGTVGLAFCAAGLGLVVHDWTHGDSRLVCIGDLWGDRR